MDSGSAIQPLLVGDAATAVTLSTRLGAGLLIGAIRPPTVQGTSRLRITLSAITARTR